MEGVFFLTQSADGGPETGESIDVELGAPGGGDPGPDPGGPGPPDPAARQFTSLYQHRDHLGTIRVVTRATGAVERALDFYPFGTLLGASGAGTAGEPRHQFTGHERDEATGLDSMQARFHDSTLASFLSVDPGPARPASPQSWNRYAYVLNNPLTLVDPSGMVPRAAGSGGARSSSVAVPVYQVDGTGGLPQNVEDPHDKPTPPPPPPPPTADVSVSDLPLSRECRDALVDAGQNEEAVHRATAAWDTLERAATTHNVPTSLLAAVGIRETGFQNVIELGGGPGVGVFQLTVTETSGVTAAQAQDLDTSASLAASMLENNREALSSRFPAFTQDQLLQATAASYNFGTGNISGNPDTIDVGTTHGNYGSNVVAPMSCF
ncbi:MAG: hypothetical protein KBD01_01160 [Acidobacteria bacterium]|nr:hypothetical protein [Acidobacteriota bacterium]